MLTNEINIRDPYILLHGDTYYLYGTRSETCWGSADGFDCYTSRDLKQWEGPFEIFHRPDGFFADRAYWAPECYFMNGAFYLVTTLGAPDRKKGIYALRSDSPTGPFQPCGERLTPEDWSCIDGTLVEDDGRLYLVFSHSFEDSPDGDMCMVELSGDLSQAVSAPQKLFSAAEAPWAHPVPFAKEEFGMDGNVYFTDGPCLQKLSDGTLIMTWSSWGTAGYAVGLARSESGHAAGPWHQLPDPIFPVNGGHGMLFRDKAGSLVFTLHYPNDKFAERPCFRRAVEESGSLTLNEYE